MVRIDPSLLTTIVLLGLLVAALVAGGLVIGWVRRDAFGEVEDPGDDLQDALDEAYEAGELDEAEYRRVRASLARQGLPPIPPGDRPRRPPGGNPGA